MTLASVMHRQSHPCTPYAKCESSGDFWVVRMEFLDDHSERNIRGGFDGEEFAESRLLAVDLIIPLGRTTLNSLMRANRIGHLPCTHDPETCPERSL